jgi:hypothetical protein
MSYIVILMSFTAITPSIGYFETFEIWAFFALEGPHIVMSRTDAQKGLDFHFNISYIITWGHWKAVKH